MMEILERIRYRRGLKTRSLDSIDKEFQKIRRRQRFLWDHGKDSDFSEYENNEQKMMILADELRQRSTRNGYICRFISKKEGKTK